LLRRLQRATVKAVALSFTGDQVYRLLQCSSDKDLGMRRSKSDVPVRKKYVYFCHNQFSFTFFETTCAVLCPKTATTLTKKAGRSRAIGQ
jgi:hypothetical protein